MSVHPNFNLVTLYGATGSGKTKILEALEQFGNIGVINLEAICHHDGSVFGHLFHSPQPSSYQFNKTLEQLCSSFLPDSIVCIEHEAPKIGRLKLPPWLLNSMQSAPGILLKVDREIRISNLLQNIHHQHAPAFKEALLRLRGRIPDSELTVAYEYYEAGNAKEMLSILLEYYDQGIYYQVPKDKILQEIIVHEWDLLKIAKQAEEIILNYHFRSSSIFS
jgi:tRNA 2-selenouridine synthase